MPADRLPALAAFANANTEVVVFDTTRLPPGNHFTMDAAPASGVRYRQGGRHLKRAFFSVVADQDLQFFHRHLSIMAPASTSIVDADWDAVTDNASPSVSPTEIVAATTPVIFTVHFFGDDHRLILKTKTTPPTKVHLSLKFSADQALAD